mmetsp:Transcript_37069/g.60049  ORF Transcript_37069/g.60049 Transcript_37069/m.60049 type:complete len:826 (-) Transcript_37069:480-2957(-)
MAETCYSTALDLWLKVDMKGIENGEPGFPTDLDEFTLQATSLCFDIFCGRAETAWNLGERDACEDFASKATDLVDMLPNQAVQLWSVLFNSGLSCYKSNDFEAAKKFLQKSFDVLSKDPNRDPKKSARTLRLLANVLLELNDVTQSIACTELTLSFEDHPAAYYLATKISLRQGHIGESAANMLKLIKCQDASYDICSAAINLFIENKNLQNAAEACSQMASMAQFKGDLSKIRLCWLQILTLPDLLDYSKAVEVLEAVISDYVTDVVPIERALLKDFYSTVWNIACAFYAKNEWRKAGEWFRRAEQLLMPDDGATQAKCLRMSAGCHLSLSEPVEAIKSLRRAEQVHPLSCKTSLLLFKCFLVAQDETQAKDELKKLAKMPGFEPNYLALAAMEAREYQASEVCIAALESLAIMDSKDARTFFSGVLRNLIKLNVTASKEQQRPRMATYLSWCEEKIRIVARIEDLFLNARDEIEWIVSMAWNMGLEAARDVDLVHTCILFKGVYEIYGHMPRGISGTLDLAVLEVQRMALVFLCLALIGKAKQDINKTEALQEAVKYSETGKAIHKSVSDAKTRDTAKFAVMGATGLLNRGKDGTQLALAAAQTERLLPMPELKGAPSQQQQHCADNKILLMFVLCNVEAKVLLGDPSLQAEIKAATSLGNLPGSLFEMMAYILRQNGLDKGPVIAEALRAAIRIYSSAPPVDYDRCSILYRMLITSAKSRHDALGTVEEVLGLFEKGASARICATEIDWLVCNAWSNGEFFYNLGKLQQAETWMSKSLALLKFSNGSQMYASEMHEAYSNVLSKLKPQANVQILFAKTDPLA